MASKLQEAKSLEQDCVVSSLSDDKIVISGVAGLYPSSHHVKDLSNILYNKINPVTNDTRWKYNHPEVAKYTGNVPGLQYFDAQFFKVHYRLCNNMDPMARKILEQAFVAIYDAGVSPEHLSGKKVGVYIGTCFTETEKASFYVSSARTGLGIAGCSKTMFANRISYWLNVKGPSMSIDEACSSSTAALECAYLDILHGECEAAIVGGANICLHPQSSIHYGRLMKLSMNNETRSFDSNASGCVRSEAINVLFLQRAKDACRMYAEIVHVKNEFSSIVETEKGPKYGFYRDPLKSVSFLKTFYEEAKVEPKVVQYVEAFGSAVPEADKAELEAIDEVFCKGRKNSLMVGSVMSNIGYGEAASGISAITKVLLAYHQGNIAANLNCDSPRQDVAAVREGRLEIVSEHKKFDRSYTAVNCLSVTGINGHVLLNGHYKPKDLTRYKSNIPHLVVVSARLDTAVSAIFDDLKSRVIDPEELALFNNIHENKTSGHLGRGFMILGSNDKQGTVCLHEVVNYFDEAKRPLWFVYSGMGSQWAGMGTQLMRIPIFAAAIERCRRVLEPKGIDIVHVITSPDEAIFDNILHSFVGIAAIQIGLTDILQALNIFPDKIIGHSVGELGCAYADGCFSTEEMILSAYCRGLVSMQTSFIRGSMAAVGLGHEEILKLCPPEVEVACHNGPDSSTISGPADIMKEFVTSLINKGIFAKEVPCSNIAYHSRYIAEAGPGLLKYLSEVIISPKPRSERWLSTSIPQDRWDEPIAKYSSAEYHTNNLLNSVLFAETSKLIPKNALVVEIAPHGLLQAILKRSLPESCFNIPLTHRGHPDNAQFFLQAVGRLYMEGYLPKVSALYPKVEFPVSTGTPMLSHLIQWAHHEKWYVPLYASANRKLAAIRNYVLSVHDDEHDYLRGHVIRGKNVYPFAATLVAVWDTLAMSLGVDPKQLPVHFQNVHLLSQPLLYERRQLRLNVTLHRGTGRFEVMDSTTIIAEGYIMQHDIKRSRKIESDGTENKFTTLNSKEIYQILYARDYDYKCAFRSILTTNLSLSTAEIIWKNNWVTFIDGMLQLNVLKINHDTASQPNFIRNMYIDVDKHLDESYEVEGAVVIKAQIFSLHDSTRCGGVLIENVLFSDLPPLNDEIALNCLKFVPFFPIANYVDENSALSIFIQIVAENLNRKNVNILEVVANENCLSTYEYIDNMSNTLPGFRVSYSKKCVDNILEGHNNSLTNVDILLTTNLAADEKISHKLDRVLQYDAFIINKEFMNKLSRSRPSILNRTISAHNIGDMKLELALWQPSSTITSNLLTVRSSSDLNLLSSTVVSLPSDQRIVILSSNPPIPGLKSLIRQYRREFKCKLNLIMINHVVFSAKQYLNQVHDCDLAFSVVDQGIWGGEYYLPIERKSSLDTEIVLKTGRIADLNSLHWEEIAKPVGNGIIIKVQYAGINIVDGNRQLGIQKLSNDYHKKSTVIDFSGTTLSGSRVMGVTQIDGISSSLIANANLLWPVPTHWSLEDAATVPLAYSMAFYILCIKSQLCPNFSILIHGGAGALGQAIISVALAYNCDVFTTVSDTIKKRFLQKLFPKLKDDHIGNSRDISFRDQVLSATKGKKCNIVIICSHGEDRTNSYDCCGSRGIIFDTAQIHNREDYSFGMHSLTMERSYVIVNFSSIFMPKYTEDMERLQIMLSEGIARGYVRPLTRITFTPQEVPRAFRLVATRRHRGRTLLDLRQATHALNSRLFCSSELFQLVWSDNEILGTKLVDRLISQEAKKIILYLTNFTALLTLKLRFWHNKGVQVKVFTDCSSNTKSLLKCKETFGQIDSMFIILSDHKADESEVVLKNVSKIASNILSKFFAIIRFTNMIDDQTLLPVVKQQGVMNVYLPPIKQMDTEEHLNETVAISINSALDALARARSLKESIVLAHTVTTPHISLLKQISTIANLSIPNDVPTETSLKELNMDASKASVIHAYLRNIHNICISEDKVLSLSIKSINDLEKLQSDTEFNDHKGLHTLFSHVDPDELLATTETIFVPTLTNNFSMRHDEFDVNETYLCVVPGVEGLYTRFRDVCERLKLPAVVLQPGLDNPHETLQEMAQRFAKILLDKIEFKNKFYLLGFETGVMVALEIAAILEDHGLTGAVFCVGGSPDEVLAGFEEKLRDFKTDMALQNAVIKHMVTLMVHDTTENLYEALGKSTTWQERVDICVNRILGRIPHSKQYAIGLIKAAYARILQVRKYNAKPRALRSLLISLRPRYSFDTDSSKLRDYSKQPIITYQLDAQLADATQDLRCASIVNRHLDNDILIAFNKKNLCDSYLINSESFVIASDCI